MFHLLNWIVVGSLLAAWSLTCWAFHALVGWTMAQAGTLSAGGFAAHGLSLPAWLAPWVPQDLAYGLASALASWGPAIESLLGQVPSLAGLMTVAAWLIWGVGAASLALLGLVFSGLIAAARRRGPPRNGSPGAPGVGESSGTWATG